LAPSPPGQTLTIENVETDARVPLRLAQLMRPHTFLTRYLRWGKMPDLAWEAKEAVILWVAVKMIREGWLGGEHVLGLRTFFGL